MANSKNLIESWLAAVAAAGMTRTEAVKELNKALGSNYRLNRTYEWQNGTYEIPPKVRDYMLRAGALAHVLETEKALVRRLTPAELRRLAERLS